MIINKSQQIRDYAAANPTATAREISTALGVKPPYVHTVLWKTKQKPAEKKSAPKKGRPAPKKWKTLHVSTSDNSVEKAIQAEVDKYHVKLKNVAPYVPMQVDLTQHKDGSITEKITMIEPASDPVNHPAHYKVGGIETIDFIEAKKLNYNMGNAVKYITRADHKGSRKQDLEKAIWYLKRELDHSV
jgi:BRCT domain type II-containing protein